VDEARLGKHPGWEKALMIRKPYPTLAILNDARFHGAVWHLVQHDANKLNPSLIVDEDAEEETEPCLIRLPFWP
jgi:hypothetical protein